MIERTARKSGNMARWRRGTAGLVADDPKLLKVKPAAPSRVQTDRR
jgi:hypothetical protein